MPTTYSGMSRTTGAPLSGADHLEQSIADILTTPLNSCVMARDYGSYLPDLIDAPLNRGTQTRLIAAVAMALMRWEPRIRLTRVQVTPGGPDAPSAATISLAGTRTDGPLRGQPFALSIALPKRGRA